MSPGFLALLGLFGYLDEDLGLLGWALAACVLHELGHVAAVALLGGGVKELRLTAVGAELTLDGARLLSYGREALAVLAGPCASLLAAVLAAAGGQFLLAGLSLGQGLFNLLPVLPLDGGRALLLLASRGGKEGARRALCGLSAVLSGLMLGGGLILLRVFGNPALLVTAGWLTAGQMKAERCV